MTGEPLLPIESVFDRGGVWYHAKGLDALSLDDTQLEDRCKTIPRAEAEQLMERFVRGDESRTTEGSGLGLSIARSLTELQGGTFELAVDGDLFKATVTMPQSG